MSPAKTEFTQLGPFEMTKNSYPICFQVGDALKHLFDTGVVKREELFITSKLWGNSHSPAAVPKTLEITLKDLKLDYLDLYLIHW